MWFFLAKKKKKNSDVASSASGLFSPKGGNTELEVLQCFLWDLHH